jgi:hypothetical protein
LLDFDNPKMTSLAAANLPSSDEEDEDFVPNEVDSDEEAQKRKNAPPKKKRGRVRGAAAIGATGGDSDDDAAAGDGDGDRKAEPVIPEHKRIEKKAKMDDLWSKLNANQGAKPKPVVNLAALCKPVTTKQSKDNADQVGSSNFELFSFCGRN